MTEPSVKWVAELAHVREVSLLGTADFVFWAERLAAERLRPADHDGRAQVLTVAADSTYRGVRFREISFSLLVARPDGGLPGEAAFLVQAHNSCRLFALAERVLFSTPYHHGDVRVSVTAPVSIRLARRGDVAFHATLGTDRESARVGDDGWDGRVFLPRRPNRPARFFQARIRGETRTYPFDPARDTITLSPRSASDPLRLLADSYFAPTEWRVRADAAHAKSKTYDRPA